MLSERLQTTLHKKSPAMLPWYSWDSIAQVKTLCNVAQKAPDNIASEKIPCNVVLILLGQHFTAENPRQYCLRGSRQHFIRKSFVQFCLNTLGTTLDRSKPYAIIYERLQATMHKKKSCAKFSYTLGTTLHSWKPYAMLPKRLHTILYKKKSCVILPWYCCENK